MKSKVYWAHNNLIASNDVFGYGPERLLSYLKQQPLFRDQEYGKVLQCPATLEHIRNTYVMRCPFDMASIKQPDGTILTLPSQVTHQQGEFIQYDRLVGWYFFSDTETRMSTTPPYMSPPTIIGACATYDISKWFRQVHPSLMLEGFDSFQLKRGEPMMYVTFDRSVDLIQFDISPRLNQIALKANGIKQTSERQPLSYLYKKFKDNKVRKIILKEIERSVL